MPCNTIATTTLDLTKADVTALVQAMTKLGYTPVQIADGFTFTKRLVNVVWTRSNGMTISSRSVSTDAVAELVKQAYTGAVVSLTAKRLGWQVQTTGENTYNVMKR